MNVIKVKGGLGNQLFQYSFGRAQTENNIQVKYNIDWFRNPGNAYRHYCLDKFVNIRTSPLLRQKNFMERDYNLNLLKTDNHNFGGYWQYLGYYKEILHILKKELCVKEELLTDRYYELQENIKNSVSVHVRRGDYVGHDTFGTLPFSYYFSASKLVKGDLYIFSDDIPWCKDIFKEDYFSRKIIFVELGQDYLEFELMKFSKNKVICNSTFSYWAALLSDSKTVIAPDGWLVVERKENMYDKNEQNKLHYPENWIIM